MIQVYKFRLYPTEVQKHTLEETLETCRRMYNFMLSDRIEHHSSFYEQKGSLPELKRNNKYLKSVHSQVLQDVVLRLDKAYQAFFAGVSRYPKFRRKGRYNTFTYPQSGFRLEGSIIRFSKIGKIKATLHRQVVGRIKRATIIRDIEQWFVALLVGEAAVSINRQTGQGEVGIDLGVSNIIALSDGTLVNNPHRLGRSTRRIKKLQRNLSKKKHGSKNRERAKVRLAMAWRRVRRIRDDFAHKLSNKLTTENKLIVFENLRIQNMTKNHSLASAIMDACWGKLRQFTAYKAERRGGRVLLIEPSGTSQKCSGCGKVVPKGLSDRVHRCTQCGMVLDRDVNAARNILEMGQELARAEAGPLLVQRRRISKFASR